MTNDKTEATSHGTDLPQRTPLDTFAQHGAPPPVVPGPERPWLSPGTPPWADLVGDGVGIQRPTAHEELITQHGWSGKERKSNTLRAQWLLMNPVAKVLLIGSLVVILLALAVTVLHRSNIVPAGVPLIGKDKGLAACEAIQHGSAPVGPATKTSPGDFDKARAAFADSRYPAIRDNGVKLMDLAVQIAALGNDPGIGVLTYIGPFTSAYAGLAGGCASVGHPIPPLNAN
jgi:hypothetical protein